MKKTFLFLLLASLSFAQLGGGGGFEPGTRVVYEVSSKNCPLGRVSRSLKPISGSYECIDYKNERWVRPFDTHTSLYSPLKVDGDFSLEFKFFSFREGCPFVRVTLFGDKTLKQAESKNKYALGESDSFVSLRGSCDKFEAGIEDNPKVDPNAMLEEYGRKTEAEVIHHVALSVRDGYATVYLNGKKVASEPFNSTGKIRGIGVYFHRRFATDKPYSDYPALVGSIKVALYGGASAAPVQRKTRTEDRASAPPPRRYEPAPQPPPSPEPARRIARRHEERRESARCIPSTGVGEASVIGGDRASAKMEALARAKWDAIEKALGVTTSVKTVVHNFKLLDEVIKNEVGGFIKDLQIVDEEHYEDMVVVKIRGCVYPKSAEKALSLISRDTAFSVIILTKKFDVTEIDEMNPVTVELVNVLNQQGFTVYDFAGDPNVDPILIEKIVAQRRFILLRAYMTRVLSGAMIVGKVDLIRSTREGQDIGYGIKAPFNVVTARLTYYLLTRDKRGVRIVASGSVSAQGRALNPEDAGYKAMEALARRLADDILRKIERYMAYKKKAVSVIVRGVRSTNDNFAIKEKLQRVPWVQSVEDVGLGKFRVEYLENTVYLANAIERMPELELISFSPTRVEAKWVY